MLLDTLLLFGMPGPMELVIILVLGILIFGAKRFPDMAKGLAQGIKEFKNGISNTKAVKDSEEKTKK